MASQLICRKLFISILIVVELINWEVKMNKFTCGRFFNDKNVKTVTTIPYELDYVSMCSLCDRKKRYNDKLLNNPFVRALTMPSKNDNE